LVVVKKQAQTSSLKEGNDRINRPQQILEIPLLSQYAKR
jgi:hypothetical protein